LRPGRGRDLRQGRDGEPRVAGPLHASDTGLLGADPLRQQELADLTGGRSLADPQNVFTLGRRPSRSRVEIWPWLVTLVAMLLVPDVALRRLGPTAAAWVEGTARPAARERETLSGRHDAWCGSAPVTPTGHQDQTQAEKIW
jgi:hypothetical protein